MHNSIYALLLDRDITQHLHRLRIAFEVLLNRMQRNAFYCRMPPSLFSVVLTLFWTPPFLSRNGLFHLFLFASAFSFPIILHFQPSSQYSLSHSFPPFSNTNVFPSFLNHVLPPPPYAISLSLLPLFLAFIFINMFFLSFIVYLYSRSGLDFSSVSHRRV